MPAKIQAVQLDKTRVDKKDRDKTIVSLREYFTKIISKEIEMGIYDCVKNYCKSDCIEYQIYSMYHSNKDNLLFTFKQDCNSTKNIIKKINSGTINPYNLAYFRPHELNEENWERIISRRALTEKKLNNLATVKGKPCRRCQGTKYCRYQLQTRSADEPMTTYDECKQCGKTKKFNN